MSRGEGVRRAGGDAYDLLGSPSGAYFQGARGGVRAGISYLSMLWAIAHVTSVPRRTRPLKKNQRLCMGF